MSADRPFVKAYLPREDKQQWERYCAQHGYNSSHVIRLALKKLSGNSPVQPKSEFTTVPETPDRSRKRIQLRLTGSEAETIARFAQAEGVSTTQWIVNLIRASLTKESQFGMTELAVLGESNRQLTRIGTNLNQIARRLNSTGGTIDTKVIAQVKQEIDRHLTNVHNAMLANRERWVIR